jgi:hypothetical protein
MIADAQAVTAGAAPTVFSSAPAGSELRLFSPVIEDDVTKYFCHYSIRSAILSQWS